MVAQRVGCCAFSFVPGLISMCSLPQGGCIVLCSCDFSFCSVLCTNWCLELYRSLLQLPPAGSFTSLFSLSLFLPYRSLALPHLARKVDLILCCPRAPWSEFSTAPV